MGTTEIIALIVAAVAAIAIVAIYMTASTRQFEKRRKQAENLRDDGEINGLAEPHSEVDASVNRPAETETASRQRRPDRDIEIEEDRARDIAAERESHRL